MNYLTRIKGIFGRIFLQGLLTSLCSLCSLYSAVALAGPVSSAFDITADTVSVLQGSFNTALAVDPCANPFLGNACAEVDVNFFPMPNGEFDPCMDCLYIIRNIADIFQFVTVGSGNEGNPDDPNVPVMLISISPDNDLKCLDGTEFGCSGTYTNTDEGVDVNWRFYGFTLNEDNFSFTGEFDFATVPVPAPATLGLIAFGLLAIRLRCSRVA